MGFVVLYKNTQVSILCMVSTFSKTREKVIVILLLEILVHAACFWAFLTRRRLLTITPSLFFAHKQREFLWQVVKISKAYLFRLFSINNPAFDCKIRWFCTIETMIETAMISKRKCYHKLASLVNDLNEIICTMMHSFVKKGGMKKIHTLTAVKLTWDIHVVKRSLTSKSIDWYRGPLKVTMLITPSVFIEITTFKCLDLVRTEMPCLAVTKPTKKIKEQLIK